MKKQQEKKIQIILILIGVALIIFTYFYYPSINKPKITLKKPTQEKIDDGVKDDQSTSFTNIEYKGLYDLNKPFKIKSERAHILNEEPDIVYMTKMHVIMYLEDGRVINIMSDKGRYNKLTYDCFFEENVEATDGETQIFAKNLDLLATDNSAKVYNEVFLTYPTGSLYADKIDYNFETKNFRVSMFNDDMIKMKVIK